MLRTDTRTPRAAETTKITFSLGEESDVATRRRKCKRASSHFVPIRVTYIMMRVRALSSKKRIKSDRSSVECAAQRIHRIRDSDSKDHRTSRANEPYAHAYAFAAHAICFVSSETPRSDGQGVFPRAHRSLRRPQLRSMCTGGLFEGPIHRIRKPIGRKTNGEKDR